MKTIIMSWQPFSYNMFISDKKTTTKNIEVNKLYIQKW